MAKGEKRKPRSHAERERQVAEAFVLALREGHVEPLPRFPSASFEQNPDDPPDIWLTLADGEQPVGVELTCALPSDGRFQSDRLYLKNNSGTARMFSLQVGKDVHDRVQAKADVARASGHSAEWLLLHEMPRESFLHTSCPVGLEAHREISANLATFFAACPFSRILMQTSSLGREYWSMIFDRVS